MIASDDGGRPTLLEKSALLRINITSTAYGDQSYQAHVPSLESSKGGCRSILMAGLAVAFRKQLQDISGYMVATKGCVKLMSIEQYSMANVGLPTSKDRELY